MPMAWFQKIDKLKLMTKTTVLESLKTRSRRTFHRIIVGFLMAVAIGPVESRASRIFPSCSLLLHEVGPTVPTSTLAQTDAIELIARRKQSIAYADIPSVHELSICGTAPAILPFEDLPVSAGVSDPFLERARALGLYEDFKPLSDFRLKDLSPLEFERFRQSAINKAEAAAGSFEEQFLKTFIATAYEKPLELFPVDHLLPTRWRMESGSVQINAAFDYTERTWKTLAHETKPRPGGSLLPSPYPVMVPAGRFQEAYYWDTYFGMKGLLATGRIEIAQMQVENLLAYVRKFGFVPNGGRDYYLSRSQPPFLSSMVREVFDQTIGLAQSAGEKTKLRTWLKERAYPLVKRDYEDFWMNPETRLDVSTGLNHHWDDINLPRPERHGADNELALGKTYRDARAGAESGLDFTDAFQNEPTQIAGTLLNSMLYKTETDLAWMASQAGDSVAARKYTAAANRRKNAMDRYLWNPRKGYYEPYHLRARRTVDVFSADAYSALFVGLADKEKAKAMHSALGQIEREGGLMASNLESSVHQWDGTNGWAPYQVMAIDGLRRYGYEEDAKRIARKWVNGVSKTYRDGGSMYERIDVVQLSKPATDDHKYPTQEGFLWTNGSFVWAAVDVLKLPLVATSP